MFPISTRKKRQERHINIKNRWTIAKLFDEYAFRKVENKSIIIDRNRFDNHIMPVFGNKEPSEITPSEIDSFRAQLLKSYKPQTVWNVLEVLRRITNFGKKKNLCKGLNFTIEMPTFDNEKTEDLSPEQLERLFKVLELEPQDSHAVGMIKLALYTGMRRGEMFRLKWDDIDFSRKIITLVTPKGGKVQRIPLSEMAQKVLEYIPKTDSPYIFPGRNGKQRKDIKKPLKRIKKLANLPPDFRPLHGLRHVYASMLASSGQVDMYTLQKLLTHKSPQMTQRYAHLRDEALKKASDLAGSILENITENANS
ncbi:tyrosine-type recombinase/integrase [candidate division KSB1 bacterium]